MSSMDWIMAAFARVMEAALAASLLLGLIWVLQAALGRRLSAGWRYLLWMPVLARLLMPVAPESSWSLLNAPAWLPAKAGEPKVTVELGAVPRGSGGVEVLAASGGPALEPAAAIQDGMMAASGGIDWMKAAALIWAGGTLLLLLRLAAGALWLSHRLRQTPLTGEPAVLQALESAAAELRTRSRPRLVESSLVESPALFGLFAPKLLLPPGMMGRLSPVELRHVFLHELAHLKRGDLWVNWLMALAQAVHWFNPLVWLAFRRIRLERELACDEMALRVSGAGEPRAYGETILRLLEGAGGRAALPGLVGIAEEKASAHLRLRQIAGFRRKRPGGWVALPLLLALVLAGLTNAQNPEPQERERRGAAEPRSGGEEYRQNQPGITDEAEETVKKSSAEEPPLNPKLLEARIPEVNLEGKSLAEALDLIRRQLPRDVGDLSFLWQETVDLKEQEKPPIYAINAKGVIQIPIGESERARQLRLSVRHYNQLMSSPLARPDAYTPGAPAASPDGGAERELDNLHFRDAGLFELLNVISRSAGVQLDYSLTGTSFLFYAQGQQNGPANASILVADARLLMEMGRTGEAREKLETALRLHPGHGAAAHYLSVLEKQSPEDTRRFQVDRTTLPQAAATRTFRVDPERLMRVLAAHFQMPLAELQSTSEIPGSLPDRLTGAAGTDQLSILQGRLMEYLREKGGVDFGRATVSGREAQLAITEGRPLPLQRAIFYNDRTGVLFVRATVAELDKVETTLQNLNLNVTTEARFVRVSREVVEKAGWNWVFDAKERDDQNDEGRAADERQARNWVFVNPYKGDEEAGTSKRVEQAPRVGSLAGDTKAKQAGRNEGVATVTDVMSDPQLRAVMHALVKSATAQTVLQAGAEKLLQNAALAQKANMDLLAAPKVTAFSGQDAAISIEPGPRLEVNNAFDSASGTFTLRAHTTAPLHSGVVELAGSAQLRPGETLVLARVVPGRAEKRGFFQRLFRKNPPPAEDVMLVFVTPSVVVAN